MSDIEEGAMRSRSPQGDAPSSEMLLRTGMGALEASLPSPMDRAIWSLVIPTRDGSGASVFLPSDAYSRLWLRAPRPPAIDTPGGPDN